MGGTLSITEKQNPVLLRAEQQSSTARSWLVIAFGIDPRSLGALRIAVALLLLVDLGIRSTDLRAHYSDWGLLPRAPLIDHLLGDLPFVSIYLISGSSVAAACLFAVAAFFAWCLLVGYRSKLATVVSWFMLSSLHTRNPMILQGGDVLLRVVLFWSIFLPLDSAFVRGRCDHKQVILSMATAALLLQVCCVYFFGALLKTDGAWTLQHTAVYNALSIEQFSTHIGRWLLGFPVLLRALTVATRWLELVGPWLAILPLPIFIPWVWQRTSVVCAFVGFHFSMALCLHLGLFSVICSVAWLPFLPGEAWDRCNCFTKRIGQWIAKLAIPLSTPEISRAGSFPKSSGRVVDWVVFLLIIYVIHWNVRTVNPKIDSAFIHRMDWIAQVLRLDQTWDMFAPAPLRED